MLSPADLRERSARPGDSGETHGLRQFGFALNRIPAVSCTAIKVIVVKRMETMVQTFRTVDIRAIDCERHRNEQDQRLRED